MIGGRDLRAGFRTAACRENVLGELGRGYAPMRRLGVRRMQMGALHRHGRRGLGMMSEYAQNRVT